MRGSVKLPPIGPGQRWSYGRAWHLYIVNEVLRYQPFNRDEWRSRSHAKKSTSDCRGFRVQQ